MPDETRPRRGMAAGVGKKAGRHPVDGTPLEEREIFT